MNLKSLSEEVAAAHPNVPKREVISILRAAMEAIRNTLADAAPGKHATPLGNVRIAVKEKPAAFGGGVEQRRVYGLHLAQPGKKVQDQLTSKQEANRAARRAERIANKDE